MPEVQGSGDHEAILKKLHDMMQKGEIDKAYASERLAAATSSLLENGADTMVHLNVMEMLSKTGVVDQEIAESEALDNLLNLMSSVQAKSQEQLAILSCLANFSSRSQQLREAMVSKNAATAVLSVLANTELLGEEVQRPAFIAFINISIEPSNKLKLIQLGAVETLLANVGSKELAGSFVQGMSLSALMSLASGDPQAVEGVIQKGATSVTAAMLAAQHNEEKPELSGQPVVCALQLLCNLSVASPTAQQELVGLGAMSVLQEIVKANKSPEHVVWALRVCLNAGSNPDLKPQLAQFGLIDMFLEILKTPGTKGEPHGIALDTLASLCKDKTAASALASREVSIVHNYAMGVEEGTAGTFLQLCACEILAGMTLTGSEVRVQMLSAGSAEVLIKILGSKELLGTDILRPTVVALVNLSIEDDSKVALQKLGVVEPLIQIVQAPQLQGTDFQVYALRTIVSLSSCQQAPLAEEMISMGVVEAMMAIVDKPELKGSEQQIVALEAMVNISAGGGKTENQFCELGAVETLVQVVNTPEFKSQAQQLWAVRALLNLSVHEGAKEKLKAKGVIDLLNTIIGEKEDSTDKALIEMTEKTLRNLKL